MTLINNYLKKKGWENRSIELLEHLMTLYAVALMITGIVLILY